MRQGDPLWYKVTVPGTVCEQVRQFYHHHKRDQDCGQADDIAAGETIDQDAAGDDNPVVPDIDV